MSDTDFSNEIVPLEAKKNALQMSLYEKLDLVDGAVINKDKPNNNWATWHEIHCDNCGSQLIMVKSMNCSGVNVVCLHCLDEFEWTW